jgi:uncharacterized membrane protein YfcA
METDIFALTPQGWVLACGCAICVGMSKAGLPGLGTVAVPLMAMVFPPSQSTGILLPILIAGDAFGVLYFHRHANWPLLFRLMPAALAGIVIGFFIVRHLMGSEDGGNTVIRLSIGSLVLLLVVLSWLKDRLHLAEISTLPPKWSLCLAITFGVLAGVTTQIANAAGPIMVVYLLAMRLPKDSFIGTSAWYFCILNWCKVPFMIGLGTITKESLLFNAKLIPVVLLGSLLGIFISARMSNRSFEKWVLLLAGISALKLLLD